MTAASLLAVALAAACARALPQETPAIHVASAVHELPKVAIAPSAYRSTYSPTYLASCNDTLYSFGTWRTNSTAEVLPHSFRLDVRGAH